MATISNSPATNAAMQKEIDIAVKKITSLLKKFDKKQRREILKPAAKIVQTAAKNNVPESDDVHFRYATAKVFDGIRAPKGKGNIVAAYHPGNLKRSIRTLLFRKSADVFVGPKISRSTTGEFKGNRVDGFYAHFVEFGTVNMPGSSYMRRAADSSRSSVIATITKEVKERVKDFKQKNNL